MNDRVTFLANFRIIVTILEVLALFIDIIIWVGKWDFKIILSIYDTGDASTSFAPRPQFLAKTQRSQNSGDASLVEVRELILSFQHPQLKARRAFFLFCSTF